MSIKIPIETSARHLHISQEDFEKLFGEGSKPHFIKELSQPGQYLCRERVTVKGPKGTGLRHLREIKITINRRNAGFFMSNFIYFYVVRSCILSLYVI